MALGCPIVAARVGGIAEIIRDGVNGLLHRPGDPDDLAARIIAMLTDPARAAELGRRAAGPLRAGVPARRRRGPDGRAFPPDQGERAVAAGDRAARTTPHRPLGT